MKRLLTLFSLLLVAMLLAAQTSATVDGIKYILDGTTAAVTYPNDTDPGTSTYTGDITIPATITVDEVTYNVTAIAPKAFRKASITSISLPEGLLSIGKEAIYNTQITEITVPNSVTTLGRYAIGQNSKLQTITFGEHIADNPWGEWVAWRSSGGYEVYMVCDAMPVLPDEYTFDDTHASTIYVKPSVYDDYAADQYWSMHNIVKIGTALTDFTVNGIKYKMLSESTVVVTYPNDTEPGTSSYTGAITIPAQVVYEGNTFNVTGIADKAFRKASITSVSLPEGLLTIGEEAFYKTQISEITVPNSVTTLGPQCFAYCPNLKTIRLGEHIADNAWGYWTFYGESGPYEVFIDCHTKPSVLDEWTWDSGFASTIHVWADVYDDFMADSKWGGQYPNIIPDMGGAIELLEFTVDGIKYKMTAEDKVSVTYPTTDKPGSSNPNPYTGDITIPAQVTYEGKTYDVTGIGNYAFRNSSITSISLPEGLISLGKEAIYKTQISEITVPNSVTTLGESCISENASLQTLTFGEHIADNKWGVWVAWRASGGYNVYMICDVMPKLPDNQTFDDTHESVIHVYPSVYLDYTSDEYWNCHTIVADLLQDISMADLQGYIATYSAMLPLDDEVGTDPGFYNAASVEALNQALTFASSLDESSSLEQRNQALLQMIVAANGLQVNPLNEGYYYIENINKGQMLYADAAYATEGGLGIQTFDAAKTKFYFKLTRKGSNWMMQNVKCNMYAGKPVNGNESGQYITLTDDPEFAQVITWVKGGQFTLQSLFDGTNASLPYSVSGGWVLLKQDDRIYWRFHPAQSGMFEQDFNIENIRVREYMADVTYTASDETKIRPYNVAPPARRDLPEPATIFWTQNASATAQLVTWSTSPDFSDALTAEVDLDCAYYEIFNLLPGQTYYYKVTLTVDGTPTDVINSSFTTSGQLRQIKGQGTANMRDLGGWATASGKPIKYGYIYRGAEWNGKYNLEPEGIEALRAVGIKAELDLRSSNEALYIDKSPLGDDVTYIRIHNEDYYESGLQNRKDLYKQDLQFVFDCVKNDKPVYFHCHIGADRTGTLALLLEGLLGVCESDLYKDYELTTFSLYETHRYKENVAGIIDYINTMPGTTLTDKFYTYCHGELGLSAKEIADFRYKMLGVVYDADVKNIVSSAVDEGETYLDLSDYSFSPEALTAAMPAGTNLLVAVSPTSGITGQNIINDGLCESLVLSDGIPFGTPIAFTAAQASFVTTVGACKTLLLPFEATVPEGFTASVAASLSGTTVNLTPTSTIAANEPVLIQGEGSLSLTATDAPIAATDGAPLCGGLLQGTYKTIPAPIGSYVLQKQQDVIGFYQVSDSQPTVKPFRAFLNVPPSDIKAYTLSFDNATGIKEIENREDPLSPFNKWSMVNGQWSNGQQPKVNGIYIINNKKILIK